MPLTGKYLCKETSFESNNLSTLLQEVSVWVRSTQRLITEIVIKTIPDENLKYYAYVIESGKDLSE